MGVLNEKRCNDITISNTNCNYFVHSQNPSCSLCPYNIYKFVNQFRRDLSFEQVSGDFIACSKKIIQPSDIILSKIPKGIENAYGIHLRKSDKVYDGCDVRHQNTINEFTLIIDKCLDDVEYIIINENEPTFLIVSEDDEWKKEIHRRITDISCKNDKPMKILHIDYTNENNYSNYNSILDMFCLSKCKEIFQGVKYSTFSILSSLLGENKLRNYSNLTTCHDTCLHR